VQRKRRAVAGEGILREVTRQFLLLIYLLVVYKQSVIKITCVHDRRECLLELTVHSVQFHTYM
jgi:hypothetical protein